MKLPESGLVQDLVNTDKKKTGKKNARNTDIAILIGIVFAVAPCLLTAWCVSSSLHRLKTTLKGNRVVKLANRAKYFLPNVAEVLKNFITFTICDICCEKTNNGGKKFSKNVCGHSCCDTCWRTYLATDEKKRILQVKQSRSSEISCIACRSTLSNQIIQDFAPSKIVEIVGQLAERQRLLINCPKKWKTIECPNFGCVGLGYNDKRSRTAMCFICEESWTIAREGILDLCWHEITKFRIASGMELGEYAKGAPGFRQCPSCGMAIVKNGGCPHMVCTACKTDFRWKRNGNVMETK